MLEKTLESPLDCKEIKPVSCKVNQSWIFIRRTDAEADALILSSPDAKYWLTGKDPNAGKDWRWEEKGTEDEMVGWHHRLKGNKFEHTLGVGDGQGSLACCSPWHRRVRQDWATELNSRRVISVCFRLPCEAQGEDGHLQTRNGILARTQSCWHRDLRISTWRTLRKLVNFCR